MPTFHIDIETTGTNSKTDDILQIGIVEMLKDDNDFWCPGRMLEAHLPSKREPTNKFAMEHQSELYQRCNVIDTVYAQIFNEKWTKVAPSSYSVHEEARTVILNFLRLCGSAMNGCENTTFMGWNAMGFDLPFLVAHEILRPTSYVPQTDGTEKLVGDYHYRVYDIGAVTAFMMDALGVPSSDRTKFLETIKLEPEMDFSDLSILRREHSAIFDCLQQTRTLNAFLRMVHDPLQAVMDMIRHTVATPGDEAS